MVFRVFFFVCISFSLFSQKIPYKDYIVLKTGDTLYGTIILKKNRQISSTPGKNIVLFNKNNRKKKYRTNAITVFCKDGDIYEEFWLYQSNEGLFSFNSIYTIDINNGTRFFLKTIKKGALGHYQLEWQEQGESLVLSADLLKKKEDHYLIRATQGLFGLKRNRLIKYFQTCPELIQKIRQNELTNIMQIVDYYNNNCSGIDY